MMKGNQMLLDICIWQNRHGQSMSLDGPVSGENHLDLHEM